MQIVAQNSAENWRHCGRHRAQRVYFPSFGGIGWFALDIFWQRLDDGRIDLRQADVSHHHGSHTGAN